jgi:glycosyltransferase involved in cell wall biosynthesis
MKVGIFRQGDGAQDFYRATLPLLKAEDKKEIKTSQIWMGTLLQEVSERSAKFWETVSSDIYLLQRLGSKSFIEKIKSFVREVGLKAKIVIDHDDDVFNVSPLSNHYVDFGTKELKIMHEGKLIHEWKHGVNIDLDKNNLAIEEFKQSVSRADMVTVTTEALANVFREYNNNVSILPNCIDLNQWNKINIVRPNPKEIRIAWYGGNSHWEDLLLIRNVLKKIGSKYPNVKIVMIGFKPITFENDYRSGQVEFHEWVEMAAHPYRLAALDIDIGVIPLKQTPFNNSKSPIKLIEFSAIQVPCVVSYISPYKEMADLSNGEAGIFIEENREEGWIEALEMLINDSNLRQSIGEKERQIVKDHFDINTQYKQWIKAYEGLCQFQATPR